MVRSPVAALVTKLAIGASHGTVVGVLAARSITRLGLLDFDLGIIMIISAVAKNVNLYF